MCPEPDSLEDRPPVRVFLVDDHDLVRQSVADLLESSGGIEVVGDAGSAHTAADLILQTAPDVAVVDLRLGDGSGIGVVRTVRSQNPEIATLVLTADDTDLAEVAAVLAGASGYALKLVRGVDLAQTVRDVAVHPMLDDEVRAGVLARLRRRLREQASAVTAAEDRLLELVVAGGSDAEIAAGSSTPLTAVIEQVAALLRRLGVGSGRPGDEDDLAGRPRSGREGRWG